MAQVWSQRYYALPSMAQQSIIMFVLLSCVLAAIFVDASFNIRAPCVFRSDEVDMHKYAAVLAATEPFRNQCNFQIKKTMNPFTHMSLVVRGKSIIAKAASMRGNNDAIDDAFSRYEKRVERTLSSYGMTTQDFNKISATLGSQADLKRRVLLQAYYYKIAADLETNLQQVSPVLPIIGHGVSIGPLEVFRSSASPTSRTDTSAGGGFGARWKQRRIAQQEHKHQQNEQLHRFASALRHIENERLKYREHIKRQLRVDELPARMSDPHVQAAMCPTIQRACQEFPRVAAAIVEHHHLTEQEFNHMQERLYGLGHGSSPTDSTSHSTTATGGATGAVSAAFDIGAGARGASGGRITRGLSLGQRLGRSGSYIRDSLFRWKVQQEIHRMEQRDRSSNRIRRRSSKGAEGVQYHDNGDESGSSSSSTSTFGGSLTAAALRRVNSDTDRTPAWSSL